MADTFNPILDKEELPRLRLFRPRPTPEPGVALVFFQPGQRLFTLWPGQQLTAGEVSWGNFKTVYRVDVTEHPLRFDCTLPCDSDAFDFRASIQATVAVNDPAKIIDRNVTDAAGVLKPLLISTMRRASRRYDVQESAEAEHEITAAVLAEKYDSGFAIKRFVVELSLEQDARDHIRSLRQIDRSSEREQKEAALQQQRQAQELERVRVRMDFYSSLIEHGQWQMLALHLANHPDDVQGVLHHLVQQQQAERELQIQTIKMMLDADALEGFQIEEASKQVLARFVESLEAVSGVRRLPGTEQPRLATSSPEADEPEGDNNSA